MLKYIGVGSTYFVDKQAISTDILNILKIGMVIDTDRLIWFSPLNPLSIAYQIELAKDSLQLVEVDDYLFSSLGYGNSLPFIEDENKLIDQFYVYDSRAFENEYEVLISVKNNPRQQE